MDNRTDLLSDMAIKGPDGNLLHGVYMSGRVCNVTKNYYSIDLPAAETSLRFPKEQVAGLADDYQVPTMYVLFGPHIKKVIGLRFTGGMYPEDYYDNYAEAEQEVARKKAVEADTTVLPNGTVIVASSEPQESQTPASTTTTAPTHNPSTSTSTSTQNTNAMDEAEAASACAIAPSSSTVVTQKQKSMTNNSTPADQSTTTTAPTHNPSTSTTSTQNTNAMDEAEAASACAMPPPRRSSRTVVTQKTMTNNSTPPAVVVTRGYVASATMGLGSLPEADASASEASVSSELTDNGEEQEVDHDASEVKWVPSNAWLDLKRKGKLTDLEVALGETTWIAPANRDQVISCDTGPEQDIYFHVDGRRTATDLFLDALPVDKFWRKVAKNSLAYCKEKVAAGENTRHIDYKWFTAANYMRVFAAVVMRGLVNCKDDPDFFAGSKEGRFHRTGAEEVVGITLNQYQQLLRYMSLVPPGATHGPSHDEFDKLSKVRPLIELLQACFSEWVTPGKDNSMDEAGIDSRHRWMRTFNPSKPSKYFMEMLEACDAVTHFCWGFIVTESASKTVLNRHRDPSGTQHQRSKFHKVNGLR